MTTASQTAGRGVNLTGAQVDLLRLAARRPQRVVRGYKPAEKLSALGLVEIVITESAYAWIAEANTAGRAALADLSSSRASDGGQPR